MSTELPAVLSVDQVAALLRCADTTVQADARAGLLPGIKRGADWVFPRGALLARLDELALEQAAERRKPTQPSGQLVSIGAGRDAKTRRKAPPALPQLGQGS